MSYLKKVLIQIQV